MDLRAHVTSTAAAERAAQEQEAAQARAAKRTERRSKLKQVFKHVLRVNVADKDIVTDTASDLEGVVVDGARLVMALGANGRGLVAYYRDPGGSFLPLDVHPTPSPIIRSTDLAELVNPERRLMIFGTGDAYQPGGNVVRGW